MKKANLKVHLKKISRNDFEILEGLELNEITNSMISHIGDTDPELRDELIYMTFYHWIIKKKYYSETDLHDILHKIIDDEHLFYQIGNSDDDTVFTRAFSVLVVALLLNRHMEEKFIPEDESPLVKEAVINYFEKENDFRGYVKNKGWADAVSHGADALDELVKTPFVEKEDLKRILNLIQNQVMIKNYVYINEEPERMVTPVVKIINKEVITTDEILDWIKEFNDFQKPEEYYIYHRLLLNIKGFLRGLYFRILEDEDKKQIREQIVMTLNELSEFN